MSRDRKRPVKVAAKTAPPPKPVVKPAPRPAKRPAPAGAKPAGEMWGSKVAVVVAEFHSDITEKLVTAATDVLQKAGSQIDRFNVPGGYEIPGLINRLGRSRRYDGIAAIGCVIRGETEHYELIVRHIVDGVGRLAAAGDIPVTFGVLAVENRKQAIDRAGGKLGNLGTEAAEALLKLIPVYRRTAHPALVQSGPAHG